MAMSDTALAPKLGRDHAAHGTIARVAGVCWLAACGLATYLAISFDFNPGYLGTKLASWPIASGIARDTQRKTLIAFLHPRCPCTQATVNNLVSAMKRCPEVSLVAVTFVP